MTKPEIIGSLRSTYTRVVCMACEEKGIDYVLTETRLGAPEIFAIHPLGKMPVLRHGDLVLFESKAIATYLDRSFAGPQLIPADPYLAGLTEQWVSFVNTVSRPIGSQSMLWCPTCASRSTFSIGPSPERGILPANTSPWPISTSFRSLIPWFWRRKEQKRSPLRRTSAIISRRTRHGQVFCAPRRSSVHRSANQHALRYLRPE
jgi:hypothetical protein